VRTGMPTHPKPGQVGSNVGIGCTQPLMIRELHSNLQSVPSFKIQTLHGPSRHADGLKPLCRWNGSLPPAYVVQGAKHR
jgi:hypothetical protein